MDRNNYIEPEPIDFFYKSRVEKPNTNTEAARLNENIMEEIQQAIREDPELDVNTLLVESRYVAGLEAAKHVTYEVDDPNGILRDLPKFPVKDVRSRFTPHDPVTIKFPLSSELQSLLADRDELSMSIMALLGRGEILYESEWAGSIMVFRVSETLVAKVTGGECAVTEHKSLQYVQEKLPDFPCPRAHGLIEFGVYHIIFSTFVPGINLERAWPQLGESHKEQIRTQLDVLFTELRKIPFPDDTPFGGPYDDGVKDVRRGSRFCSRPIMNIEEFEDFIFDGAPNMSATYKAFLRGFLETATTDECIFTHGDLRPHNIMVKKAPDGNWSVISIIDWESSGFYPDYWESVKMTNSFSYWNEWDWYHHLPRTLEPKNFAVPWLVDHVLDRDMMHS